MCVRARAASASVTSHAFTPSGRASRSSSDSSVATVFFTVTAGLATGFAAAPAAAVNVEVSVAIFGPDVTVFSALTGLGEDPDGGFASVMILGDAGIDLPPLPIRMTGRAGGMTFTVLPLPPPVASRTVRAGAGAGAGAAEGGASATTLLFTDVTGEGSAAGSSHTGFRLTPPRERRGGGMEGGGSGAEDGEGSPVNTDVGTICTGTDSAMCDVCACSIRWRCSGVRLSRPVRTRGRDKHAKEQTQ